MINKIFLSFISAIIILLLISCNDSPTDLGTDYLIQDGVEVLKLDSSIDSIPQSSYSFKNIISLGSSSQLLIGNAENVTSHTLLRFVFALPDSIIQELTAHTLTVTDSWVELTKSYTFGDSNSAFDYKVFKINSDWNSSTFTADSFLTVLSYDGNNDLSSFRQTDNDTTYSFHIDTTVTSSWLQNNVDETVASNYGILLSPTDDTKKVLGFTAYNTSSIDDPRIWIVVQKPGEYIDTLIGYIASDISVVLGNKPDAGTENLVIQSSLTSEAKLFFDLSVLPKNITINSANLTLTVDTLLSKTGSSFTNSLRVYLLADSSTDSLNANYVYTLSRSGATYTGLITNIVRAWNNNLSNEGMLIKATGELYGVEIFAIKGSNAANLAERPKLEIVYSRGVNN